MKQALTPATGAPPSELDILLQQARTSAGQTNDQPAELNGSDRLGALVQRLINQAENPGFAPPQPRGKRGHLALPGRHHRVTPAKSPRQRVLGID